MQLKKRSFGSFSGVNIFAATESFARPRTEKLNESRSTGIGPAMPPDQGVDEGPHPPKPRPQSTYSGEGMFDLTCSPANVPWRMLAG